ncbi:MAG: DUF1467 family protein [Piscinibacter sp.]
MIGRLNHVAIAVSDIAKAAALYRDTLGARVTALVPQPAHGVTVVFVELPNTKIELLEPLGDDRPIANFLDTTRTAASTMSATRWTTSRRARQAEGRGRARARRRRAEDRRARQAGAVPASEGFQRHAGRARAGMSDRRRGRDLFHDLVAVLFAVLPFGVRSQVEAGSVVPGSDRGAPVRHRMLRNVIWTTMVSAVIFGLYYANFVGG